MMNTLFSRTSLRSFKVRAIALCAMLDYLSLSTLFRRVNDREKLYSDFKSQWENLPKQVIESYQQQGIDFSAIHSDELFEMMYPIFTNATIIFIAIFATYHTVVYLSFAWEKKWAIAYLKFFTCSGAFLSLIGTLFITDMPILIPIFIISGLLYFITFMGLKALFKKNSVQQNLPDQSLPS